MDNYGRFDLCQKMNDSFPVTYIQFMVLKMPEGGHEPFLVPASVSLFSKENGPLIIVNAMYPISPVVEIGTYFRADKA